MQPSISVVVPMLDEADSLGTLLTSLMEQVIDDPWEIIVVDNGSTDHSADLARALLESDPPPNLIRREVVVVPSPQGYATPRNAGARRATAPLLAFCDADDAVDEGWLGAVARALEHHALVVSRTIRARDISVRDVTAAIPEPQELPRILGRGFAMTGGLGCTRELFEALGGFDPHFDSGGEDVDFSFRARHELGIDPVVDPDAIYWTTVPSQPMKTLAKGYRDGRSQVRLYQRHRDELGVSPSGPSATARGLAMVLRRLVRFRRSRREQSSIIWEAGCVIGRAVWSTRLGVPCY